MKIAFNSYDFDDYGILHDICFIAQVDDDFKVVTININIDNFLK